MNKHIKPLLTLAIIVTILTNDLTFLLFIATFVGYIKIISYGEDRRTTVQSDTKDSVTYINFNCLQMI